MRPIRYVDRINPSYVDCKFCLFSLIVDHKCCTWPIDTLLHFISYQRIERTVRSTEISYSTVGRSYIIDTQRRPTLVQRNAEQISSPCTLFSHRLIGLTFRTIKRLNAWVATGHVSSPSESEIITHWVKWRHRVCGHDTIAILWV